MLRERSGPSIKELARWPAKAAEAEVVADMAAVAEDRAVKAGAKVAAPAAVPVHAASKP